MGWIWLDGVEAFVKGKSVKAWKRWQSSFPSAYLIEMMAQAGAILLGAESNFQDDIVFTKIEKTEFLDQPKAGQRLEIEVHSDGLRREGGWFRGQVSHEGKRLLEGRVLLMNIGRLRPDGKGPITFPETLIEGLKEHVLQ